jgi:hypothetical protein
VPLAGRRHRRRRWSDTRFCRLGGLVFGGVSLDRVETLVADQDFDQWRGRTIPAQCGSMSAAMHQVWSDGQTNADAPPRENSDGLQSPAFAGEPPSQISASESDP